MIHRPKIKNIYYDSLQDLDNYYFNLNDKLFIVSKTISNKNDSLETIYANGQGYLNNYYFRLVGK